MEAIRQRKPDHVYIWQQSTGAGRRLLRQPVAANVALKNMLRLQRCMISDDFFPVEVYGDYDGLMSEDGMERN
jgi:hypothetical protein